MAVDMFLKLESVEGESQDANHAGEIDVLSFSWGARQSGTGHLGGGSTGGKVEVQNLSITKYVDRSTPVLFFMCCSGEHLPKAELFVRKAGGKAPVEYYVVTMEDLIVTSVEKGAGSDQDRVTETVTLNFARVKIDYTPQKADGSGGPVVVKGWNIEKNEEFS